MNQTAYWIVSICLSGSAFIVSLISLGFNWKNRVDQKAATRLSKKTELLTKLVEVKSTFGHLAMIYAQQLLLIKDRGEIDYEHESERVKNNLDLVLEQSHNAETQYNMLRDKTPADLAAWEDMLLTTNSFFAHSKKELEKEQGAFNDLRKSLE